jgi:hypothetical protein
MKFQHSGFEHESRPSERALRVVIMVGMWGAQWLIGAVMLLLAMSGMGVNAQVVLVGGHQDLIPRQPRQQDEWAPDPSELNRDGLMKMVDVNAAFKNEQGHSQPELRRAFKRIGQ